MHVVADKVEIPKKLFLVAAHKCADWRRKISITAGFLATATVDGDKRCEKTFIKPSLHRLM
jgi:hypothetical protein